MLLTDIQIHVCAKGEGEWEERPNSNEEAEAGKMHQHFQLGSVGALEFFGTFPTLPTGTGVPS
jgi:hypothetical protein